VNRRIEVTEFQREIKRKKRVIEYAEIEADMAAQLARVRDMERNGELEPIPEVSTTSH